MSDLSPAAAAVPLAALRLFRAQLPNSFWMPTQASSKPTAVPAVRFDRLPPLDYAAGTLTVDSLGRYRVGQCSLQFDGDSRIQQRGKTAGQRALRLGQQLVVSGHPLADGSLMVRSLTIMEVRAVGLELADYPGAPVGELAGDAPN